MDPIHRSSGDLTVTGRVIWLLRVAIALQAAGVCSKYLLAKQDVGSAIRGVLVAEWKWSEQHAHRVDEFGAIAYGVCGLFVLLGPAIATALKVDVRRALGWLAIEGTLLAFLAVVEALLALGSWHRAEVLMSSWTPIEQVPWFTVPLAIIYRAVRILMPVALILLIRPQVDRAASIRQLVVGMWVLRIAAALTFAAHGVWCLCDHGVFLDHLSAGAHNILGWDPSLLTLKTILRIIGVIDLLMACLMLLQRWRFVPLFLAAWAFIGAWSHVIHAGWSAHFELTIRSANYCVPLAVWWYFRWCFRPDAEGASHPASSSLDTRDEKVVPPV